MNTTSISFFRTLRIAAIAGTLTLASPLIAQDDPPESPPPDTQETDTARIDSKSPKNKLIEQLFEEVQSLRAEVAKARQEAATAQLQRDELSRELDELRQFMRDNREFGDDFAQYKKIKEITRQAERRRAAEEARKRHSEERARRLAARNQVGETQQQQQQEQARIERYQRAGFEPLGLDVFLGRTGFFYGITVGQTTSRIEYEPVIGHFLEPAAPISRINYSSMTISGTVLNASDETRNVGIAIAFFDRSGNQVGSETIQINNARPNVPYPFTSTIDMGLDGPFASSTSWVLYADKVE